MRLLDIFRTALANTLRTKLGRFYRDRRCNVPLR